jgi:hypothetical protein
MAQTEHSDSEPALSPREVAHLRNRDRKRTTTMVVDNAGVKRILQARGQRAALRRTKAGHSADGTRAAKPPSGGSTQS